MNYELIPMAVLSVVNVNLDMKGKTLVPVAMFTNAQLTVNSHTENVLILMPPSTA